MKQEYASQDVPQDDTAAQPDLLAELEARQALHEQEAAERAAQQMAREQARAEVEADMDALNSRIEQLLSANPEEFVIRFLQTEGQ